jgi:hypothetical protein
MTKPRSPRDATHATDEIAPRRCSCSAAVSLLTWVPCCCSASSDQSSPPPRAYSRLRSTAITRYVCNQLASCDSGECNFVLVCANLPFHRRRTDGQSRCGCQWMRSWRRTACWQEDSIHFSCIGMWLAEESCR